MARIFALVFALFSAPAFAQEPLRMGYVEFAPYYYTDKDGHAKGHMIDMAKAMAKHAGYSLTFRSYPPRRLARSVVMGKTDLFLGMSTLSGFAGGALISSMPIDTIELRAYSLKPMPPIEQKEDLNGKRILLLHGYSYGDWSYHIKDPRNKIEYHMANTHTQALSMLERRPIDYLLDYKLPIAYATREVETPQLHSNKVFTLKPRMMVSKKHPQAETLMKQFEEAFLTLYPNGVEHLKAQYLP